MAAQFVDGRLRKPTELYAASAWKRYEEYIAASAALVAQKLKGDTIRFKQAVADAAFHTSGEDKKTLWYLALSNPLAQLSPLFRYCVAISLNWFELAQEYRPIALQQYRQHPSLYREHWAAVIPDDFYQLAEQV